MENQITLLRKLLVSFTIVGVLLLLTVDATAQKMEIYHRTGNPAKFVSIKINAKALQAHLAHGDHLSSCAHSPNELPLYPVEDHGNCGDGGSIGFHDFVPAKGDLNLDLSEQFCREILALIPIHDCNERNPGV